MTSKNDITGDSIQSRHSGQKKYADNWEKIFGKKEKEPVVKEPQNPEEGEFSLDQHGEQVQFKDGKWERSIFP